jgi:transmembrane sensor
MSEERKELQAQPAAQDVSLSDEAIDWLVRLNSGRAIAEDRRAFRRWRRRSAAHEAAAREAEAIFGGVGETRQADRLRRGSEPLPFRPRARRLSRRFVFAGATAASVAAVAVGVNAFGPLAAFYADHATRVGERRRVALPDGSMAFLNTATALSVDYSVETRRLVLHQGEALFEVAKDRNRPFVAVAGDLEAWALGTTFAVRRVDANSDVIVTEGTVEVRLGTQDAVRLEAGQSLDFGAGPRPRARTGDADAATAWQRGKLIFNRRPLQDVVAELERYRAGRIAIMGERLKTLQVTGVFDLDDPDRLLRALAETTQARIVEMPLLTIIR